MRHRGQRTDQAGSVRCHYQIRSRRRASSEQLGCAGAITLGCRDGYLILEAIPQLNADDPQFNRKPRIISKASAKSGRDAVSRANFARYKIEMIEIHSLRGLPEIRANDDLAALLRSNLELAGLWPLRGGDILVVTQKILSKSEGRMVDLTTIEPGREALDLARITLKDPRLVELVLRESCAVVRAAPHILITRHRLGHVMANSGIDRSNIGPGEAERALLLPMDPDASANALLDALAGDHEDGIAVVISDSFGRPWRHGVVGVAIGAAGLPALIDRRGEEDRDGRMLEVTQIAFADQIATAATLATGEGAESIPAALIRGLSWPKADKNGAAMLVRPVDQDLFR